MLKRTSFLTMFKTRMYFHYRLQFCQGFLQRTIFKWMYASQGQKNIQVGSNYHPQPNAFSFHFVKGNFLSTIFVRWHESEYFVQKITNRINSDLLRFPPMKQPKPRGCIRRQLKISVSTSLRPHTKISPPPLSIISLFLVSDKRP